MKKLLLFFLPLMCMMLAGCNSDDSDIDVTGKLVVTLQQETAVGEEVDFSDYSVAIIPESGWIVSADMKDITWPVEVKAGTYTVAAASPLVSETETTQSWYYGEVKNVEVLADLTTRITIPLVLTTYPKVEGN